MNDNREELQRSLAEMAILIDRNDDLDPQLYALFFQRPQLAFQLIELMNNLDETVINEGSSIYSACVLALDICVAQLQSATEANNKVIAKLLTQLMDRLAEIINTNTHSLSYWLPVLNAFYEVHVNLTQNLKNAYFNLANHEADVIEDDPVSHLNSIRDLIHELSDLSIFEIAENFFAQSYAMPTEFFSDLVVDLYSITEGQEIALLMLLHPKFEVREIVIATLDQIIEQIILSSISLSRLQMIKNWYPEAYHVTFERWIKVQRKKGVIFEVEPKPKLDNTIIKATEVDGTGAQGIFIHLRQRKKNRLGGMLLKHNLGLKDVWITPYLSTTELSDYYSQAFEENVTLRKINGDYLQLMVEHFLALSIELGSVPNLQFLEIQELLGIRLKPNKLDIEYLFQQLSIQITPFTPEVIAESLQRSRLWLKNKTFTESWYLENSLIDKIVNHNSSFVDGVKICRLADAIEDVFVEEMEANRSRWQFHFLWTALWAKVSSRKNEKTWQDSFLIAYTIYEGKPLKDIPIMREICHQTVLHSIDTMQERKTHLSQE